MGWPAPGAHRRLLPQYYAGMRVEGDLVDHPELLEPRTRQTIALSGWATDRVVEWALRRGERGVGCLLLEEALTCLFALDLHLGQETVDAGAVADLDFIGDPLFSSYRFGLFVSPGSGEFVGVGDLLGFRVIPPPGSVHVGELRPGCPLLGREPRLQLAGFLLAGCLSAPEPVLSNPSHLFASLSGGGDQHAELPFECFLDAVGFVSHDPGSPVLAFRSAICGRAGLG